MDQLNQIKIKGLVLGPFHTLQADQLNTLNLKEIDPTFGKKEELEAVLERAHKKSRFLFKDGSFELKLSSYHVI